VIIDLPSVSGAETTVSGTLSFGVGVIRGATVHTLDSNNHLTTIFNGQNLTSSFIDSGSNAFFFPDSLPTCDPNAQFFCPSEALPNLSAINVGKTQGVTVVDFSVDNAESLYGTYPGFAAFSALAGPSGTGTCSGTSGACTFDWGLPFFYGRKVYTKIDACNGTPCSPLQGAWWAY
jgi:hypothetical protein